MDNNKNSLDDLIGTGNSDSVIIRQDSGDKKLLYTLLIVLVVLFIIAIGVIAFMSGKYFSSSSTVPNGSSMDQNRVKTNTIQNYNSSSLNHSKDNRLDDIEAIVNEVSGSSNNQSTKEYKKVSKVASAVASEKKLSQDDLAKIAQLVAQELNKSQVVTNKTENTTNESTKNDSVLVTQLEEAQADTLGDQKIESSNFKDVKINQNTTKKIDTFNRVVVNNNSQGDDELAKLSSEIDNILKSEEVKNESSSYKYKKALDENAQERANESRFIVVKRGDTLSSLALKAYGRAAAFKKIYKANPELVKNPNRIYIGMKLRVPMDKEYIKQSTASR